MMPRSPARLRERETECRMEARTKQGFTLIEMLIAVAITGIIATLIYGSFARTFESREYVLQSQERYHMARLAMDRMTREISMAFVIDCSDQSIGSGERRYRTPFKVEDESEVDRMQFASFSHLRLFRDVHESDQNILTYYGETDPVDTRKTNLMRKEKHRIDGEPDDGGQAEILCRDIEKLDIQLWDELKSDWVKEWNCSRLDQQNRLPRMVKLSLSFYDEEKQKIPLTGVARIFTNKPLRDTVFR